MPGNGFLTGTPAIITATLPAPAQPDRPLEQIASREAEVMPPAPILCEYPTGKNIQQPLKATKLASGVLQTFLFAAMES